MNRWIVYRELAQPHIFYLFKILIGLIALIPLFSAPNVSILPVSLLIHLAIVNVPIVSVSESLLKNYF